MCTFYNTLPKKSKSEGTNKKRNLVMSLKPCADDKTYYRFRILAFSSDGKNDRDYPFITRFVHQVWGKHPEKGYPMVVDEITCPVTPHVHVDGNRYQSCKICDLAGKYFGTFKASGYTDKEAGKKNKEFSRKFQGIVPVYVVSDPNYEGNNGKFKVLVFGNKAPSKKELETGNYNKYNYYDEFKKLIENASQAACVFNGENAVDCCIHVSEVKTVVNEGQPNQYEFKQKVIDKIKFSNKPYSIPSINKQTVSTFGFDEDFYTSSTPDEILAFYNRNCKVSNDDIPDDDDLPVYDPPKNVEAPKIESMTNDAIKINVENESVEQTTIPDEDLNALTDDLVTDPDNEGLEIEESPKTSGTTQSKDVPSESIDDLLNGIV